MRSPPLRALITGFGPFPGITDNASAAVAQRVADSVNRDLADVRGIAAILPTEWEAGPRALAAAVAEFEPHLCLHLGVSPQLRGLVIESFARNGASERHDAVGRLPRGNRLIADAPAMLFSSASPLRLAARMARAGLPVSWSLEAGDYICNAIYFQSLWLARRLANRGATSAQVALLHLPVRVGIAGAASDLGDENEPLAMEQTLAAIVCVLREMAGLIATASIADSYR